MSFIYTNNHDVSLALAVFLMYDSYDHDSRNNVISATSIIKPLRQLILTRQHKELDKTVDIMDLVNSRMGTAIHDGCEVAWTDKENVCNALKVLGANQSVIDSIVINPTEVTKGQIPVYVEQRHEKEVGDYIISGKYDLILDGTLNDYKSTSVWTYIYDSNASNYTLQGSIYRWLAPDHITSDYININYIFTDWSATKAKQDSNYPQKRVITKKYPLMSVEETEEYLKEKLMKLDMFLPFKQEDIPECTDEDLWASETVYKYYKNPKNLSRSTKNFSSATEAAIRQADDGNVGIVIEVPGEVKACRYCKAVAICNQAEKLINEGRLLL